MQIRDHERIDHSAKRHPLIPAATEASTAATSPRTITMYLPEQMERDNIISTSEAFNIASAA